MKDKILKKLDSLKLESSDLEYAKTKLFLLEDEESLIKLDFELLLIKLENKDELNMLLWSINATLKDILDLQIKKLKNH